MADQIDQFLSEIQAPSTTTRKTQMQGIDQDPVDTFLNEININQALPSGQDEEIEKDDTMTKVLKGVAAVGEFIDRFSGAPARKALQSGLRKENPLSAFTQQFLASPELAPTGKQIAVEELGISPKESFNIGATKGFTSAEGEVIPPSEGFKFSPAGAVGLGIDIAADPLAFIPIGKVLKTSGGLLKKGTKYALKGSAAAADFALGTDKLTTTGEIIGRSMEDISKSLSETFSPHVSKDFDKLRMIAAKNNIDTNLLPESIEFGKDSFIDRASRQRRELGGASMDKFKAVVGQTSRAVDDQIKKIGGTEDVLDNASAGALIRDAYDRGVEKFFDSMDVTHNEIIKYNPGLKVSKEGMDYLELRLKGIEKFAKGRIERGADPVFVSQGKRLLKNVANIRKTNGSYKQIVETLREIGEISYTSKNIMATIPADIQKMRTLYSAINDALIHTVEKSAQIQRGNRIIKRSELANNLILNNNIMTDFFGDKAVLKRIGDKNLADEALFKNIILNGDSKKIKALRNIISPEDFNQLKATFLNDGSILKVNQDGNVLFSSTFNAIDKKKNIARELLTPLERDNFVELLDLGHAIGIPVLSTSGTAPSLIISNIISNIKNIASNDLLIENLKQAARNKQQIELLNKFFEASTKEQAKNLIKRMHFPKKLERAALNRLRKNEFKKPSPIVKIPQVISVQRRNQQEDEEE